MIDCYGSRAQQAFAAAEELERVSNRTQEGLLNQILTRVNDAVLVTKGTRSILPNALAASRLRWLQQLGARLVTMMSRIQNMTSNTYNTVISMNANVTWLCSQVLLLEAPIVLIDSHGDRMPVHLKAISSWDAFDALIEVSIAPDAFLISLAGWSNQRHRRVLYLQVLL